MAYFEAASQTSAADMNEHIKRYYGRWIHSFGKTLSNSALAKQCRAYRVRWPIFYIESTRPIEARCSADRQCTVKGPAKYVAVSHEQGKRSVGTLTFVMDLERQDGRFVITRGTSSKTRSVNHDLDQSHVSLVVALQAELERHGCQPGPVDGLWGDKSRDALQRFSRAAERALGTEPSQAALRKLVGARQAMCL